jgi:hypothetical protein
MSNKRVQIDIHAFVSEAQQVHELLQADVDRMRGTALGAGLQIELMQFYGHSFGRLVGIMPDSPTAPAWQCEVLHEAVIGRTAYWEWQRRPTSVLSPLELYQMQLRWQNISRLVLDRDGSDETT